MFVPLTEYQGGGAAATIEPLKDHLPHYETRLANLFGAGVQACYRGPRLYDTRRDQSRREAAGSISTSSTAPSSTATSSTCAAPDGRDWDGWLHVNPHLANGAWRCSTIRSRRRSSALSGCPSTTQV